MPLGFDCADAPEQFRREGVAFLPQVLDRETLRLAESCFRWTLEHPGAGAVLLGTPGTFYQDQANPDAFPAYRELLTCTTIPDLAAALFDGADVWLRGKRDGGINF